MSSVIEIAVKYAGKLAIIQINRPRVKNALTRQMYGELTKILNEISENNFTTITAITGTGDFFSSGNDFKSAIAEMFESSDPVKANTIGNNYIRELVAAFIDHKKVLAAVVNGPAIGIAATTLALCDIVYAVDTAYFSTPFTKLGLCCEGCSSYTFPRIFGASKAAELLLFCKKLTAKEALDGGLVAQIYSKDDLEKIVWPTLKNNAEQLSAKSLISCKRLMRSFETDILHRVNIEETSTLLEITSSEEAMEAILKAFNSSKAKL